MNRYLQWINLLGIGVLMICCVMQWQANRQLNLRQIELESLQFQQGKTLADKDQIIQGNLADMNAFRDRVARSEAALSKAQATIKADDAKLADLATQRTQLQAANDALKKSLEQWESAVAARDRSLAQAADQATKLVADRNDAVSKFNELATRYNAAEEQLKQASDELQKLAADRNEAVVKFNDLADKYNALVKQVNAAATKP